MQVGGYGTTPSSHQPERNETPPVKEYKTTREFFQRASTTESSHKTLAGKIIRILSAPFRKIHQLVSYLFSKITPPLKKLSILRPQTYGKSLVNDINK